MRAPVEQEAEQLWAGMAPLALVDPWCVRFPLRLPSTLELLWESEGVSAAGFGIAAERTLQTRPPPEWISALQQPVLGGAGVPLGPWFGGLAFDGSHPPGPEWSGFPAARFFVPELLVVRRGEVAQLWAFSLGPDGRRATQRLLEEALRHLAVVPPAVERPVALRAESDRLAWNRLVQRALTAIEQGMLQKVVAARRLEVTADRPLDAWACTQLLRKRAGQAAAFLVRGTDGSAFVGATPERLVRVMGDALETQALASSARLAQSATLACEDKEQREHFAVVEDIRSALGPLTRALHIGSEPRLLELPYIAHLRTPVQASLRPGVGVAQVLEALYPTAAVGGAPRSAALAFIGQEEGWDRGWYAGGVGWIGPHGADLHVAIRSGRVAGTRAQVFVGAGLVAGSVAEREWQETEDKARPFLRALQDSGEASHALP